MALLNPYLSFDNNCREAMNFYKDCFGGELFLQTVAESPAMAAQMPAIGGQITDPLADMPWGAKYGAITDKYGKHWVFNFPTE